MRAVWNPAVDRIPESVGTSSKSFVPSDHAPCCDGIIPVSRLARDGVQVGLAQYARSNLPPSLAKLSSEGVRIFGFTDPKADQCCWSEVMSRTLSNNWKAQQRF